MRRLPSLGRLRDAEGIVRIYISILLYVRLVYSTRVILERSACAVAVMVL